MRITNHQAFQGHPVPKHVYYVDPDETPFAYEVLDEPEMVYEDNDLVDDSEEEVEE
jgi:hypothetical protein